MVHARLPFEEHIPSGLFSGGGEHDFLLDLVIDELLEHLTAILQGGNPRLMGSERPFFVPGE